MSEGKPLVYIFHGEDRYAIGNAVKQVSQDLFPKDTDEGMISMNTSKLDGRTASMNDLVTATGSMPFLTEHRLVILTDPTQKLMTDSTQGAVTNLLNGLPPWCTLVLVIEDDWDSRKKDWQNLKTNHWLRNWVKNAGSRVKLQTLSPPKQREMPNWIIKRTEEEGGKIQPAAAVALAEQVGNDTGIAAQEIKKLLTFVEYRRPVTLKDVELLTPYGVQTDVFKLVDMMSSGDTAGASRSLHALLEREEERFLFSMIIRQFRLLIQARDLLDRGAAKSTIQAELKLPDYVVGNLINQASRFPMDKLEVLYRQLYQLDKEVKNWKVTYDLALDMFIAGLKQ